MLIRIFSIFFFLQQIFFLINGKSFEYELPNRTVTICPAYSLITLECPQIPSSSDIQVWQSNLPRYFISIDHIRSFPILQNNDVNSCQPDHRHPCENYDLRYINTLCNGKTHCSDIPTYQIRDRSHCAFKAVTEIGYHCVPTWHLNEIQTKCDICKNGSLTNDYGFIYSRNYPLKTIHSSCFTTIYARPNHKTILYFVHGQLNYDQLRIESVTAEGLAILNITLNGNLTTQRLGSSTYETRITFTPSHIYSAHSTYFLLYFYTIPICSITEPCLTAPSTTTTTTTTTPYFPPITYTTRSRVQSVGWTRIPNIWVVIPIILAYVLLLLLIVVLALCLQRRRKQQKRLENLQKLTFAARYVDNSGTSSRAQLVSPYPSAPLAPTNESLSHLYASQTPHYPHSFAQNADRYHRESRSDYNLHENSNDFHRRTFDTVDYPFYNDNFSRRMRQRRSLPKSFSDCDLCKRRVLNENFDENSIENERNENWHWQNSLDQREKSFRMVRPYREKLKERVRERLTVRHLPENERISSFSSTLPHSPRTTTSQQLPFEYLPNDSTNQIRTVEYQRNGTNERFAVDNRRSKYSINDNDDGTSNFTVKFYSTDELPTNPIDPRKDYHERSFHDAKEVQEMSMRMNEQIPYPHRYSSYSPQDQQQQRRFNANNSHC